MKKALAIDVGGTKIYSTIINENGEEVTSITLTDDVKVTASWKIKKFNIENKKLNEEGNGICTLTNDSFSYVGDLKVKEFSHDIITLRALAFSCGEEFECYYQNELYYFYPKINKKQCVKWALIVDELVKGAEVNE